jgi:hypothetical protein
MLRHSNYRHGTPTMVFASSNEKKTQEVINILLQNRFEPKNLKVGLLSDIEGKKKGTNYQAVVYGSSPKTDKLIEDKLNWFRKKL